jgi:thiamine kinase-like enzyme
LDREGHALVLGHGDLKPTNVLASPRPDGEDQGEDQGGGGHSSDAVLIDFELSGINYRGFDLCKLFRCPSSTFHDDLLPFGCLFCCFYL